MKERFLRRDLPILQASGLKAKSTILSGMPRRIDRTGVKESKSFELGNEREREFPQLQVEPTPNILRPRNGSLGYVRDTSYNEKKPVHVRRERSQSNASNNYSGREEPQIDNARRKPLVLNKLKSFNERRPDAPRYYEQHSNAPTRAYSLISNHLSTSIFL